MSSLLKLLPHETFLQQYAYAQEQPPAEEKTMVVEKCEKIFVKVMYNYLKSGDIARGLKFAKKTLQEPGECDPEDITKVKSYCSEMVFVKAREFFDNRKFTEANDLISSFLSIFPRDEEAAKFKSICKAGVLCKSKINVAIGKRNFGKVCLLAYKFLYDYGRNSKMEKILNRAKLVIDITRAYESKEYTKTVILANQYQYLNHYEKDMYVDEIKANAEQHLPLIVEAIRQERSYT